MWATYEYSCQNDDRRNRLFARIVSAGDSGELLVSYQNLALVRQPFRGTQ